MKSNNKFITTTTQIVYSNLDNPNLNGQIVATILGISRMHLHRQLKKYCNQNTSEFILKIRLQYAQQQLKNTHKYIYQIAKETGYTDAKYFTKVFKKKMGQSPTLFRKGKN